jgi:hypothetical protein
MENSSLVGDRIVPQMGMDTTVILRESGFHRVIFVWDVKDSLALVDE